MADYELVEPFCTGDASLANLDPEFCFALGVEWEQFRQKLKTGEPFTTVVISANVLRLSDMAERHRRFVEHRPSHEGWASITVGDYLV